MSDQLIASLIDRLSPEQCVEMQRIVESNGAPFDHVLSAIRAASPEVIEALAITMALPGIAAGKPMSPEMREILPAVLLDSLRPTQYVH